MELVKNIFFNTDKIVEGATVKISYVGHLFQNDSKDVYLHYGYGENWNNIGEIKAEKTDLGYQAEIKIPYGYDTLNLCYKNDAGEWDNNCGNNYIFDVEPCEQNISEIEIESISESNVETSAETKIDVVINAEINSGVSGVNADSYYNNVSTDNITANTHNVYDVFSTIDTKTTDSIENISSTECSENIDTTDSIGNTYLAVTKETGMQMHKGLKRTYLWSKKIKLAIYKIIKYVPKIISGNYKRKVNE